MSITEGINYGQPPKAKAAIWKGHFELQGIFYPLVIKNFRVKVGDSIKGKGRDDKGKYEIKGKVGHDHSLTFKMVYNKSHAIQFMGTLDPHGDKINGTLEDFGQQGSF